MNVPPSNVHHKGIAGWFLVPKETFEDYDDRVVWPGVVPRLCESPDTFFQINFVGLLHFKDREITGRLIDFFGPSTIIGGISTAETELKFEKSYDSRRADVRKYYFEKRGDLWVGRYKNRQSSDGAYRLNGQPAQAQIIDIVPAALELRILLKPEVTVLSN